MSSHRTQLPLAAFTFSFASTHGCSRQHSPPAVFSYTGASAAFALLPPFYSLPAHSCLHQPLLSQSSHLHFTRVRFRCLLTYSRFWQHSPLAVFSHTSASVAFALLPPLAVFLHSCLYQPSLFAAFSPALHTCLFSQSSLIRSLPAAFASCGFLTHGHFGSIRSSPAFLAVRAFLHTVACVSQRFSQPSHLHFTRVCFAVFSHTVAFGSIRTWVLRQHSLFSRPFWQSSCIQLLVYDYGLRRYRIPHPGHRGPPPTSKEQNHPLNHRPQLPSRPPNCALSTRQTLMLLLR